VGAAAGDENTTSQASYSRCTLLSAMMCGGNAWAIPERRTIYTSRARPEAGATTNNLAPAA
jgi:hypothetical protein